MNMRKLLIMAVALLGSYAATGQILDSIEIKTPGMKVVESLTKDEMKGRTLGTTLDSLKRIYGTNRFRVWFFYDDGSIIEKVYSNTPVRRPEMLKSKD